MDLSKLNVTAAADNAKRFEILDPFEIGTVVIAADDNETQKRFADVDKIKVDEGPKGAIYSYGPVLKDETGTPLAVHILGMRSTVSKNESARIEREKPFAGKKTEELTDEESDQRRKYYARANAEKLAAMITKLEGNWQHGDKSIKASNKKELADVLEALDNVAIQLVQRSANIGAYRPEM